jgi:hypothetical protein
MRALSSRASEMSLCGGSVRRVRTEEEDEAGNGGGVGGTLAAHDDEENVDGGARPMLWNIIGKGVHLSGVI